MRSVNDNLGICKTENIGFLLQNLAFRHPERLAILAPGREPMTYSRLLSQLERTKAALTYAGIQAEDRIAVVLPAGPELAVSSLAVAVTASCALLNPALRQSEFDTCFSWLKPRALIVELGFNSPVRDVAAKYGTQIIELEAGAEAGVFSLKTLMRVRALL